MWVIYKEVGFQLLSSRTNHTQMYFERTTSEATYKQWCNEEGYQVIDGTTIAKSEADVETLINNVMKQKATVLLLKPTDVTLKAMYVYGGGHLPRFLFIHSENYLCVKYVTGSRAGFKNALFTTAGICDKEDDDDSCPLGDPQCPECRRPK